MENFYRNVVKDLYEKTKNERIFQDKARFTTKNCFSALDI